MNIKFKDLPEYKSLCKDIKKASLKIKNKNIHCACIMRNLCKQFPKLKLIDEIVKKYYEKNEKRIEADYDDEIDVISDIIKLVRKIIPHTEISYKIVNEYVQNAYTRITSRIKFNKKYGYAKKSIKEMIKNAVRSKKISDEKERKINETKTNIGIYNFMRIFNLGNLRDILTEKMKEYFKYFCKNELENDDSFTDYHVRLIAKAINCPMLI